MVTDLIFEETVQAIADGILLSAPTCTVCQDGPLAVCHCPRGAGFDWFDLDGQPETGGRHGAPLPGRVTPPSPVHRQDTTAATPVVDAGSASTQVMPAVTGPKVQRTA